MVVERKRDVELVPDVGDTGDCWHRHTASVPQPWLGTYAQGFGKPEVDEALSIYLYSVYNSKCL